MLKIAAGTALTAFVIAVVGWITGGFAHLATWGRQKYRQRQARATEPLPDHVTIASGWFGAPSGGAAGAAIRVSVACAPSTLRPPARLDAEHVESFVAATFGSPGGLTLDHRDVLDVIRYRGEFPASPSEAATVNIWSTGLVEAAQPIPGRLDTAGQGACISIARVIDAIAPLMIAVHSGVYSRLYGVAPDVLLDWRVALSSGVNTLTGWAPLRGFDFPGLEPRSGPAATIVVVPPEGLAHRSLRSRTPEVEIVHLLRPVVCELLDRAGYVGYDEAVEEILANADRPNR